MDGLVLVTHHGQSQQVALFEGLAPSELSSLLQAAFRTSAPITGLHDPVTGVLLPLSLACKYPSRVNAARYELVLTADLPPPPPPAAPEAAVLPPPPPAGGSPERRVHYATPIVSSETSSPGGEADEDDDGASTRALRPPQRSHRTPAAAANPIHDREEPRVGVMLVQFVGQLHKRGTIDADMYESLCARVQAKDHAVYAAFRVAMIAGDVDFLGALLVDIGKRSLSEEGTVELGAQSAQLELLEVLAEHGALDTPQQTALQELILLRSNAVAAAYNAYSQTNDIEQLLATLHEVANAGASASAAAAAGEDDDYEDDDAAAAAAAATAAAVGEDGDEREPRVAMLRIVIEIMQKNGILTEEEADVLLSQATADNEFMMAALEVYENNGKEAELADTLQRLAKLEVSKAKLLDVQERLQTAQAHQQEMLRRAGSAVTGDEDEDDYEDEDEDEDDYAPEEQRPSGEDSGPTIPVGFMKVCESLVQHGLVAEIEAVTLARSHAAGDPLVTAAWDVYQLEEDIGDLVDTLLRIVRRIKNGEHPMPPAPAPAPGGGAYAPAPIPAPVYDENGMMDPPTPSAGRSLGPPLDGGDGGPLTPQRALILEECIKFLLAKGMLQPEQGLALLRLAKAGNSVVFAALEVYEVEKDLEELIDTLVVIGTTAAAAAVTAADDEDDDEDDEDWAPEDGSSESDDEEESDDEDSGDESVSMEQAQLLELVVCLVDDGKMSDANAEALRGLINVSDDRVMAALDVYQDFQDVDDLIDTLMRICRIHLETEVGAAGGPAEDEDEDDEDDEDYEDYDDESEDDDDEDDEDDDEGYELTDNDRIDVVSMMRRNNVLTDPQAVVLVRLLVAGDANTIATFNDFELTRDASALVSGLRDIINEHSPDEDEDDEGDDVAAFVQNEEEAYASDSDKADPLSPAAVSSQFLALVRGMQLDELQTAALRLCIARDDPHIRAALEVFRVEQDEGDLCDTLRRIARKTVDAAAQDVLAEAEE